MISRVRNMMNSLNVIQTSTGKKINICHMARDIVENRKLIYFGEIHSVPNIVELQEAVLESLTKSAIAQSSRVHVFMEHFSLDDQKLIDGYVNNNIKTEQEFVQKYDETSSEGHDIEKYVPIFKLAKNNPEHIALRGAFIPRLGLISLNYCNKVSIKGINLDSMHECW